MSVNVTFPRGGESFQAGQQITVEWTTTDSPTTQIVRISLDGGVSFTGVSPDLAGSARSFTFNLPSPAATVSQTIVRVAARDALGNQIARGDSPAFTLQAASQQTTVAVTAPLGGTFAGGQTINVQWTTTGPVIGHAIRLSLDNGATFTNVGNATAAARSFSLTLPSPATQVQAVVRVAAQDAQGNTLGSGNSPAFTIQAAPQQTTVVVTAPLGGSFAGGQTINVQWTTTGPVTSHAIRLSLDNGATFTNVGTATASARSFSLTLPSPATQVQAVIRVAAQNAQGNTLGSGDSPAFTIQAAPQQTTVAVKAPLGGSFAGGQTINVQWTTTGPVTGHAIRLSLDNGATFTNVGNATAAARSFSLTLPSPATQVQAVVRVAAQDAQGNTLGSGNSPAFTIQAAPQQTTVVVTAPLGGTFAGGQTINVQWTTTGPVTSHAIRLSLDNGATFTNVGTATAAARSFSLTLPSPATQVQAVVRVAAQDAQGNTLGSGNSPAFTIQAAAQAPPPRIDRLDPARGPVDGTTTVSIFGAYFVSGCTVRFGGMPSPRVEFRSSGELRADTPSGAMAGLADVKVTNPDGRSTTLASGFRFDPPLMLREISPNAGPQQQAPLQVVSLLGQGFLPGAEVYFGMKPSPRVTPVGGDGMRLDAEVPAGDERGPVKVEVRNPDGQRSSILQGFTYLGPRQQGRARISKVTPSLVLEGVANDVTVTGRNLERAFREGLFAVRGPAGDAVQITIANASAAAGGPSGEDVVTFSLTPKVLRPGGLGFTERLPLQVVASVRPRAADDLLTESSGVITAVSRTLPSPVGFSTRLVRGGPNLVVVTGRNLSSVRLEVLEDGQPVDLSQAANDRSAAGVVVIPADANGSFQLRVRDGGREIGTFPLALTAPPADDPEAAPALDLAAVPGQMLVGTPGRGQTVQVRDGQPLAIGQPLLSSAQLKPAVSVPLQLISAGVDLPLVDEAVVLPAFGRGRDPLGEASGVFEEGKFFSLTGLAVLLVVRVTLRIDVAVAVIPIFDPFRDADFGESFNDFGSELPSPFSDFPGVILYDVVTEVSISVEISYLESLLLPGGGYQLLIAEGISAQASGGSLVFDSGVSIRATIDSVRPLDGALGQATLLSATPVADPLGFRALFFATGPGRACLPWAFEASLSRGLLGEPPPPVERLSFQPTLCVTVEPAERLRTIRIEPSALELAPGESQAVRAFERPVDRDGLPLGPEKEISPREVAFRPDEPSRLLIAAQFVDVPPLAPEWWVTGLVDGIAKLQALVPTRGPGNGILPEAVLDFAVQNFADRGETPLVAAAEAAVDVMKGEVPMLVHPVGEKVRVTLPYLNVMSKKPGVRIEYQVADGSGFGSGGLKFSAQVDGATASQPIVVIRLDGNPLAPGEYRWRARFVTTEGADWSAEAKFTIDRPLSRHGESWLIPIDKRNLRVNGVFMEGYFHGGYRMTRLHGGTDFQGNGDSVFATRSGIVQTLDVPGDPHFAVLKKEAAIRLRHPLAGSDDGSSVARETNYLHMKNTKRFPVGTFVNQGAYLGQASNVGIPKEGPHLHFDLAAEDQQTFFNPLALPFEEWDRPGGKKPEIQGVYLRSDRFLSSGKTGIKGTVQMIVQTIDPGGITSPPPSGERLAPYRVDFSTPANPMDRLRFDRFTVADNEKSFYAYDDPAGETSRRSNTPYLIYRPWDTRALASNLKAGPQQLKFRSYTYDPNQIIFPDDFTNASDLYVVTIGPRLTAAQVKVPAPVGNQPRSVALTLRNETTKTLTGVKNDTFPLEVRLPKGAVATLSSTNVTVSSEAQDATLRLTITKAKSGDKLTVVASSGICMDIKDSVEIEIV
ncbi:MAG TPA: IPT/TIG domain-containing protein [Thermoanaerobaculia bacterium]|jgi:hypothetical protein|nr:IPT/TIG domain-containing protein [Thermoanaerobaculia bacterium]